MVSTEECLFCKIVRNEIPSRKIYEDSDTIAILDINPANPGHVLIVPKEHSESIVDISDSALEKAILVTKRVAAVVSRRLSADGINILQNNGQHAGQLVAHFHIHVIPRFPDDKVVFTYQRTQMDESQLDDIQNKLKIDDAQVVESNDVPEKNNSEERETPAKTGSFGRRVRRDWELES